MPITTVISPVLVWPRMKLCMEEDVELLCWTELNEHKIIGPDLVRDTEEKVQIIQ